MTDTELKPCPFCGSEPNFSQCVNEAGDYGYTISCGVCGIKMDCEHQDEVLKSWNHRAAPQIPEDVKTIAGAASCEFFARAAFGEGEADVIIDLVTSAILAERERIALMIENYDWVKGGTIGDIAAAIRGQV